MFLKSIFKYLQLHAKHLLEFKHIYTLITIVFEGSYTISSSFLTSIYYCISISGYNWIPSDSLTSLSRIGELISFVNSQVNTFTIIHSAGRKN